MCPVTPPGSLIFFLESCEACEAWFMDPGKSGFVATFHIHGWLYMKGQVRLMIEFCMALYRKYMINQENSVVL